MDRATQAYLKAIGLDAASAKRRKSEAAKRERKRKADYIARQPQREAAAIRRRAMQAGVKRLHAARMRAACPPWADREAIAAIYAEAQRITRETGIPHEVDHIEPLLGKGASGLHVHYNLRVVTRTVNRRKSNKRPP